MNGRPPSSPLFPSTPLFRSLRPLAEADWPAEPLESVILRRGSTRRFDVSRSLTFEELSTALAVATASIPADLDRKSTRLNSSHSQISYAVFCLKHKHGKIVD